MSATARRATGEHRAGIASIVDATGLFPAELLDGLLDPALAGDPGAGTWFVAVDASSPAGDVLGAAWVRPEPLTERTWNLVALGVAPDARRRGVASVLLSAVERHVAEHGGAPLIVETSSTPDYAAARALYDARGYRRDAVVTDYWAPGDDKIVFSRRTTR